MNVLQRAYLYGVKEAEAAVGAPPPLQVSSPIPPPGPSKATQTKPAPSKLPLTPQGTAPNPLTAPGTPTPIPAPPVPPTPAPVVANTLHLSAGQQALGSQPAMKIGGEANPYNSLCPTCSRPAVSSCRCWIGDKRCADGHSWHNENGKTVLGTGDHGAGRIKRAFQDNPRQRIDTISPGETDQSSPRGSNTWHTNPHEIAPDNGPRRLGTNFSEPWRQGLNIDNAVHKAFQDLLVPRPADFLNEANQGYIGPPGAGANW